MKGIRKPKKMINKKGSGFRGPRFVKN